MLLGTPLKGIIHECLKRFPENRCSDPAETFCQFLTGFILSNLRLFRHEDIAGIDSLIHHHGRDSGCFVP